MPIRKKKKEIAEQEEDPKNAIPPEKVVDEAFDFKDLDDDFARNIDKLKEGLSKLRPGGRLDPEVIENFRVTFSGRNGTERLGDLATNLRAVTNTIGTSQHSLNPIPDPESALTLNVDIPPPTTESRNAVKHAAKELMETANHAIRQVRGDYQKKLRKLELDKKTRVPKDEMVRAHKEMEKKNEAAVKEVKRIYEERIKALDR
ncbi:putative ribosome recycling factor domain-containing protein [Phaeomoniella chlamydospora]|uniref:Putative ribosome recycling factor domain-containing protein n=1 Tax=Phaeomoniella chlamydospora TaxID=158046 RepID=A0A0G2GT13_PHACM|nr:putative ribosome recycling factor domain-containing protein [Phaeomoniella chlamydospora]